MTSRGLQQRLWSLLVSDLEFASDFVLRISDRLLRWDSLSLGPPYFFGDAI
jgi:hypothetical protein